MPFADCGQLVFLRGVIMTPSSQSLVPRSQMDHLSNRQRLTLYSPSSSTSSSSSSSSSPIMSEVVSPRGPSPSTSKQSKSDSKSPEKQSSPVTRTQLVKFTFSHTWSIDNVKSYLNDKKFPCITSKSFTGGDEHRQLVFTLKFYPKGQSNPRDSGDHASVYFYVKADGVPGDVWIEYNFALVDKNGERHFPKPEALTKILSGRGFVHFIEHSKLFKSWLVDDQIRLYFKATVIYHKTVEEDSSKVEDTSAIRHPPSDLTISVDGTHFHAHKHVITSRVPFFADSLKESIEDRMEIIGVTAEAFEQFLGFIYTDKVPEAATVDLLAVADKFQDPTLKQACECGLVNSITVESVGRILELADKCRLAALKTACLEYFVENSAQVLCSPSWLSMTTARPELCIEACRRMAAKNEELKHKLAEKAESEEDASTPRKKNKVRR